MFVLWALGGSILLHVSCKCYVVGMMVFVLCFFCPDSTHRIEESAFCAMLDHAVPSNWPMYELSAFLFFLGPMLIIAVLYIRMGLTIQSRMIKFPGETKHLDTRTKPIIRMLGKVACLSKDNNEGL
jgi:hypothetical protein